MNRMEGSVLDLVPLLAVAGLLMVAWFFGLFRLAEFEEAGNRPAVPGAAEASLVAMPDKDEIYFQLFRGDFLPAE